MYAHAGSKSAGLSSTKHTVIDCAFDIGIVAVGCAIVAVTLFVAAPNLGPAGYLLPIILAGSVGGLIIVGWMALGDSIALTALLGTATLALQLSFRDRPLGETGLDPQNGLKFACWSLFLFIGYRHRALVVRSLRDPALAILLAYSVLCLASTAWSPVPIYTGASAVGNFAWLGLAIVLAARVEDKVFFRMLAYVLAIECLIALVASFAIPAMAWLEPSEGETVWRLKGLAGHPNVLAQHAALLAITVLGMRDEKLAAARWSVAMLGLAFGTLYLTNSRTAMMAVGASIAVLYLWRRPHLVRRALPFASVGTTIIVIVKAMGMAPDTSRFLAVLSRSGDAAEITTVTGRSEIWQITWEHFKERPLLGWGFNGSEQLMTESVGRTFEGGAVNAHNVLLQGLMTLGLLGSVIVIAIFYFLLSRMLTRPNGFRDRFAVFVIVLGFGEADFLTVPVITSFLLFWSLARDAFDRKPHLRGPFASRSWKTFGEAEWHSPPTVAALPPELERGYAADDLLKQL